MASSLGELFIELGVFADTKELQQFETKLKNTINTVQKNTEETNKLNFSITKFIKSIRTSALAISGALYAINRLTNSLIESNQQFLNLTRTSDISLSTFQKWDNIGKMFGIKNAAQQLEGLNERLFDLMLTGQGAEGFMLAGINPMGQSAEGVIEQLRNRVSGLSDTAASYLLKQMGLDPTMLHLLRMTRQEFDALQETVRKYQLTDAQRQEIQKLNIQLQIAGIKLQYIKDRAILALMPIWLRFIESLARVSEGLGRIVKGVNDLLSKLPGLKEGIIAIGAAFMIAFQPVWALLTAIYLIIDDIVGYFQGKDSLFGHFINGWKDFQKEWQQNGFKAFMQPLANMMNVLPSGLPGTGIIKGLAPAFSNAGISNNTSNNYDNRQITVQADIHSNQPSFDIQREISSAQYVFSH